jgi:hypothetical protein
VALSNWNELLDALVMPKVWVSLLIALLFVLGTQAIFTVTYTESKSNLVPSGLTLWLLAIISLIVISAAPVDPTKQIGLTGLLLATVSIGTGFISLGLSNRTQEKTIAMANHGIYEKTALIHRCLQFIDQTDSELVKKEYGDQLFYEIKAAKELQKISSPEVAKMLDVEIKNLINRIHVQEKYEYLKKRLAEAGGEESIDMKTDIVHENDKPPAQKSANKIKKFASALFRFGQRYFKGECLRINKIMVVLGLAILILVLNDLPVFNVSLHLEVNIAVPILILIIGYLPLLNPKRKKKRSWKEFVAIQLDLLEIILLAFFVVMDSVALMSLFPDNYRQQNIIFFAGFLLLIILVVKMIRYQSKEVVDNNKPKDS